MLTAMGIVVYLAIGITVCRLNSSSNAFPRNSSLMPLWAGSLSESFTLKPHPLSTDTLVV